MKNSACVTILGARGTICVEGPRFARYGGGTACVLVQLGGETFVLDGGTGIMELARVLPAEQGPLHLLLSHPHFDHMLGLPSCPVFFDPARHVHLHAVPRAQLDARAQLERLMSPPLWPVGPDAFLAAVEYCDIQGDFQVGTVTVRVMEGTHPGGSTVFRLTHEDTSIVYASDCELDENTLPALASFAANCSLLLCDGQYSDAEFEQKRGFGHTSWRTAVRLAIACGAQQLRVLHHAPWRTDKELDTATPILQQLFANGAFARSGEEIEL